MPTRRDFLRTGAAASAALLAGRVVPAAAAAPLRILVLGGTGFIGPHLVRHAVSRGHRVTTFTRGRRKAELPAGVEQLVGDRNAKDAAGAVAGNYEALRGRRWDVVFDDSATNPVWVQQATAVLRPAADHYVYVSSTGVYYPYLTPGATERTPVHETRQLPGDDDEAYGVAKAQSELAARRAFGDARTTVVRPTYIVGPGDTSDRFPYWPARLARGGDTLAPGRPSDAAQLIDVRDLAAFMVGAAERRRGGTFNLVGPREPLTSERFLATARAAVGSDARIVWLEDYRRLEAEKLLEVVPWVIPTGNYVGATRVSNRQAVAAGLTFRPLADTVRDTLAWWRTVPAERQAKAAFTITPEREQALLASLAAAR